MDSDNLDFSKTLEENLLQVPRADLPNKLTKRQFQSFDLARQRLIIVLEQIAYLKSANSGRELGILLNIPQPSIQDYLVGKLKNPLRIEPERLRSIAAARGITDQTLRAFLSGDKLGVVQSQGGVVAHPHLQFLELTELVSIPVLLEALPIIKRRVLAVLGKNPDGVEEIGRYLQKLPLLSTNDDDLEDEQDTPQPYPGNLKLYDLILKRKDEIGLDEEGWQKYCELFLHDMTIEDLMTELQTSEDPIPNKVLSGSLSKLLSLPVKRLYEIRDEEDEEKNREEDPEEDPEEATPFPSKSSKKVEVSRRRK